jgi:hypothetical protein
MVLFRQFILRAQGGAMTYLTSLITTFPTSLTVPEDSGAVPIGIQEPIDTRFIHSLSATVTGLPTDGTISLSDGTLIANGESLTLAQLTGLQFTPTPGLASGSSDFTYDVTDRLGTDAIGSATLIIDGSGGTTSGGGTVPPPSGGGGTPLGEDQFTTSSLDPTKWNAWLGQNGYRWTDNGLLPAPFSGETVPASPYNAEYYDPYPYGGGSNTSGSHMVGGPGTLSASGGLELVASPSSYFSGVSSAYQWGSAWISSTGHPSMELPATGGYVSITAKLPDDSYGAWPAFWFLGEGSNSYENVDWEFGYSASPNSEMALGVNDRTVATPFAPVDLSQGYHTYGTKYVPGQSYTFYLDGQEVASTPTTNTGAFELTLGLQMADAASGGWHTVADPVNHPGPFALDISDVRIDSLANADPSFTFNDITTATASPTSSIGSSGGSLYPTSSDPTLATASSDPTLALATTDPTNPLYFGSTV